ncbi:MAG: protein kinase, partial [Candidatus Sumerlaeia bacterium]|nr:protein kinase [Candidatus Sumerlaeia bacterium]
MTFSRVDSFLRAESSEAMHEAMESRSIPTAWGATSRDREIFRLDRRIGEGGFGEIWRAEQSSLARVVAVKRLRHDLPPEVGQNTDDLFRQALFLREALTTARLDHPYIVPVYSLGVDEQGFDALGMKLVEGLEWADVLAEDFRALEPDQFLLKHVTILHSVAQAVAFAHSRGILHRDIKPTQVMLGRYGEVYLTDWGLAFVWTDSRAAGDQQNNPSYSAPLMEYSNPAGTPAYMAPEQTSRSVEQLGPHTDVYLLGATLYQLLTGRPPHAANDSHESFEQARRGEVVPPRQRASNRAIPAELEEICLRALAPQPADRYATAEQFLEALDSWRTGSRQRREAAVILHAQEQRLATSTLAYTEYNAVLGELDRARVLAPANARIGDVQQVTLQRYARAALDNDDLVLARSLSGRLTDPDEQHRIADAVALAEHRRHRQETQRRAALVGVAALLLVILAGAFKYSLDQRHAAERLMEQRNAAERARGLAEEARDETAAALLATDEARRQAEQARDETAVALHVAEEAREQVAAALRAVELEQYSSSMTIARTAIDSGDVATARD